MDRDIPEGIGNGGRRGGRIDEWDHHALEGFFGEVLIAAGEGGSGLIWLHTLNARSRPQWGH